MKRICVAVIIFTILSGCQSSDPADNNKDSSVISENNGVEDSAKTAMQAHRDSLDELKDQLARTIFIKPGTGIDNISFRKSTEAEVLKYKNLHYKVVSSSEYEGDDQCVFWKSYECDSMGIIFTFTTQKTYKLHTAPDSSGLHLTDVTLTKPSMTARKMNYAYLPSGKYLWESIHDDLVKELGKPTYDYAEATSWKNIGVSVMYSDSISKRPFEIHLELPNK